jgi:hypothetical protein
MSELFLLAKPWWVNLLDLVPAVPFFLPQQKIRLPGKQLLIAALFAIAFGFVEAAVVVYLRAATGLWPGPPATALAAFPESLLKIECYREAATMIMLCGVSWLTGRNIGQRAAAFLWMFAFWDLFYYVWLRLTIGWPASFLDTDILFLIPTPWIAQVWLPLLISILTGLAIWLRCSTGRQVERRSAV